MWMLSVRRRRSRHDLPRHRQALFRILPPSEVSQPPAQQQAPRLSLPALPLLPHHQPGEALAMIHEAVLAAAFLYIGYRWGYRRGHRRGRRSGARLIRMVTLGSARVEQQREAAPWQ